MPLEVDSNYDARFTNSHACLMWPIGRLQLMYSTDETLQLSAYSISVLIYTMCVVQVDDVDNYEIAV